MKCIDKQKGINMKHLSLRVITYLQRQTDRHWCIRAHRVSCTGELKKGSQNCFTEEPFWKTDPLLESGAGMACCGQPWKWHMIWKWTFDGLCGLQMLCGFGWNIKSSFNRKPGPLSDALQAGAWVFPPFQKWLDHVGKFWLPVPTFGSIWVVLWL